MAVMAGSFFDETVDQKKSEIPKCSKAQENVLQVHIQGVPLSLLTAASMARAPSWGALTRWPGRLGLNQRGDLLTLRARQQ